MHFRSALLLASLCLAPAAQAIELPLPASGEPALRIQGSNTIGARLAPALLTAMLKQQGYQGIKAQETALDELRLSARSAQGQDASFLVYSHGSSSGFQSLQQGLADLAASSRPVQEHELATLGDQRNPQTEHVIAIDGLAIITHPDNPVRELSMDDLARVFAGKVKDWSELGSFSGPINLYARDGQSGTWDTFKTLVLATRGLQLSDAARRFESSEQLSDQVSADPQAIGFIGLPYIRQARALAIRAGDSVGMLPTPELVASEDYPLSRRLFLYTPPGVNPWGKALADFAESDAGQEVVASSGFVPQSVLAMQVQPAAGMPPAYVEMLGKARRLNATFRFAEGSAEIDTKALRDVERVVDYLKSHDKIEGKVVLVGFDEPRGNSDHSLLISRLRAIAVQRHLVRAGVLVRDNIGMGDALPVADNSTESGRLRNRRVEVWVY